MNARWIDRSRVRRQGGAAALALLLVAVLAPAASAAGKGQPKGGKTPRVSHTTRQSPPVLLGTSGGWRYDLANGYCCGGTLGALVEVGGAPHILSNWHVFAMDTAPGGNGIVARTGDPVIQPGLIDVRCSAGEAQVVGALDLALSEPPAAPGVNVDAALARAEPGMVAADGAILEVGPPSSLTVPAFVGQGVKKSGRTTRLSRSAVTGLYATVSVAYEDECAGRPAFTKVYTGQILVKNRGGKFLAAGDSGSVLLEDVDPYPRAVGLLFAGSSLTAVANPIDEVLASLGGARMIGVAAVAGGAEPQAGLEAGVARARAAQLRHAALLEGIPGSVGHAVGLGRDGGVALKVLVEAESPRARAAAPRALDGVPVEVEAVGRIVAY